jgi:pantothenate kinase type III
VIVIVIGTSLLKQATAEQKNFGGLAVCPTVRISLADP